MIHCGHFIDGRVSHIDDGERRFRENPTDQRVLVSDFPVGTVEEAQTAIRAATLAYPGWRAWSAPRRGRLIAEVARLASSRVNALASLMTDETGKPLKEAEGEIAKGLMVMGFYAGAGLWPQGEVLPSENPGTQIRTRRFPLGVVSLITPWNFPWAVPIWKIAPALVAGNTVVWKPSPHTPAISMEIARLFQDASLPAGVLNMVQGDREVGEELVRNQMVRAVSFTGHDLTGRAIYRMAAERGLARVCCEMGGNNAALVWKDADLSAVVKAIVPGVCGTSGQRCTATARLIIHTAVATEVINRLVEAFKAIKVGRSTDPETQMGPLVSADHLAKVVGLVDRAREAGLSILVGGHELTDGALEHGYFFAPTIIDKVPPEAEIFQTEVFGPVLTITEVGTFEEAVAAFNGVAHGHAGAIFTQDPRLLARAEEEIEVGNLHLNEGTPGGEAQVPFGGWKATGIGPAEQGRDGLEFFTRQKAIYVAAGSGEQAVTR